MIWKWSYFFPAAFFAGYLMLRAGAPLFAVTAGWAVAAFVTWSKSRKV